MEGTVGEKKAKYTYEQRTREREKKSETKRGIERGKERQRERRKGRDGKEKTLCYVSM